MDTQVAIVGGGLAGAAVAIRLAEAGLAPVLFERRPSPRWRASGVFSSPLTRIRLSELGLAADRVDSLIRPISALNLKTVGGARCRLDYGDTGHACGFDRPALDVAMLERARLAGADVHTGAVVRSVTLDDGRAAARLVVSSTGAGARGADTWRAMLVVGADGPRSMIARAARVASKPIRWPRAGVTFHRSDSGPVPGGVPPEGMPMEGYFVLGREWYVGIAPVPRGRVNVGIVVPASALRAGPALVVEWAMSSAAGYAGADAARWQAGEITDAVTVALPLAHRVRRAAGRHFALVGDAAGFIDPLSGEGLHRALVSSELGADAIIRWSRGDGRALADYDRRLRARFRNKDIVSWLLQAFLAQPALLDHAVSRLARRTREREVLRLVLTDQLRPSRALDPRFLARLLAP